MVEHQLPRCPPVRLPGPRSLVVGQSHKLRSYFAVELAAKTSSPPHQTLPSCLSLALPNYNLLHHCLQWLSVSLALLQAVSDTLQQVEEVEIEK